jgi:hypothetical protein
MRRHRQGLLIKKQKNLMIQSHTPEFGFAADSGKPQIVSSLKICGFPESAAIHQVPECCHFAAQAPRGRLGEVRSPA